MNWLKRKIGKHPRLKKNILACIWLFEKCCMYILNKILGVDRNKVVFISFGGKSYSDNPRAISEKLKEMYPNFKITWLFINPEEKREIVPDYVKCVKADTYSALKELATAKFWVDNFTKSAYIYKSKDQIYIQTWHGDRGFKKVLYDSPNITPDDYYIEQDICDVMTTGSDFGIRKLRGAFGYEGDFLACGAPRNDLLCKHVESDIINVKNKIGIQKETKVVLFAPTFRRESQGGIQDIEGIDLSIVVNELEIMTNNEWICIIRGHSATKGLRYDCNKEKILDATAYEDMRDLLLISDLFITDYSSSAGDYILLKRPLILFQPDKEDYMRKDRTFYFDIDESPFICAFSQQDLLDKVRKLDNKAVEKNCEDIKEFYGVFETGEASIGVVEYMMGKLNT